MAVKSRLMDLEDCFPNMATTIKARRGVVMVWHQMVETQDRRILFTTLNILNILNTVTREVKRCNSHGRFSVSVRIPTDVAVHLPYRKQFKAHRLSLLVQELILMSRVSLADFSKVLEVV